MNPIRWITTTEHLAWQEREAPSLSAVSAMPSVLLQLDNPQQTIEGFGASFNEMGWDALALLDADAREDILRDLFAPGAGLNLSLCRMPVGANDFSRDWYSYDEQPGDLALDHFSIEHDEQTLLPFIHAAQQQRPGLRLWASPWSPPTWMKSNGHYAGAMPHPAFGNVQNGLREDQVGHEGTDMFLVDDAHLTAYARYFGRFIDAYAQRGIRIDTVMPQNEFNSAQPFPSCTWTPESLARFIRVLGPEMDARDVQVFLGTLERADDGMVTRVLDDPEASPWVRGLGAQWAGRGAVPFVHHDNPDLPIWQTEQECGDGRNDWRHARHAWQIMRAFFNNGATAYMYWNMALLEGGVSRWGWSQNSFVVVDPHTREHRLTHEYQLLKHVSHLVQVGARVVPTLSYSGFENQLAFTNPDGSLVIVAHNDGGAPADVSYLVGHQVLAVTLDPDSFHTFVIPPTSGD
ncbi:glycoside hydrolase family 30 beta sandwich domain-containing protein [Demequina capsici]|uniref:Glycoside hydrolase family 30 beta sandwich domain-containing protein n=1 Tax=Demequina capsici TaxID=3075620 RepID=A0AA96FCY4_9MICO|nr:glycoside hydrolase family 30 beta sandwich domain-containing protein [Demequina sp. PMTSA13]WNM27242.1 glycoside hydrolase family 30 beta sandwich domain-containing protein [Demequina sp. PMTSA13]